MYCLYLNDKTNSNGPVTSNNYSTNVTGSLSHVQRILHLFKPYLKVSAYCTMVSTDIGHHQEFKIVGGNCCGSNIRCVVRSTRSCICNMY
jgi:hypothetical protein